METTADVKTCRLAIIGSGFGGMGLAWYLKQAGITDFVILEKADDLGGTWRENTYPGAACDMPSHLVLVFLRAALPLEQPLRTAERKSWRTSATSPPSTTSTATSGIARRSARPNSTRPAWPVGNHARGWLEAARADNGQRCRPAAPAGDPEYSGARALHRQVLPLRALGSLA